LKISLGFAEWPLSGASVQWQSSYTFIIRMLVWHKEIDQGKINSMLRVGNLAYRVHSFKCWSEVISLFEMYS
jgi:hypothetical protein